VAGTHVPDVLADRLDRAREVDARPVAPRLEQAGRGADDQRPGDAVPVRRVHRGRTHPDKDEIVGEGWLFDLRHLEHVGPAVAAAHDRLHLWISFAFDTYIV